MASSPSLGSTYRETAAEAEGRVADVYDAGAALIGARRDEIAFVESATRAWDTAFYAMRFRVGRRRPAHPGR